MLDGDIGFLYSVSMGPTVGSMSLGLTKVIDRSSATHMPYMLWPSSF